MLRIASQFLKTRTVLYPKQIEYRLVRISQGSPNFKFRKYPEREPCPLPPPPPPPKPADDTLFWGAMFLTTLVGACAVYAQRSPEIRDWLTIYAPWFDDFIAVLYQENMSYHDFIQQCIDKFKNYMHKDDKCAIDPATGELIPSITEKPKGEIEDEEETVCKRLPPPVSTKNICEVECCLKDLYEITVNNYDTAKVACSYYSQLVEDTMIDFSVPKIKELYKAMNERNELVKVSLKNAAEAQKGMDELTRYMDCGIQASPEAIEKTRDMLNLCNEKIKAARIQFQWENDKAVVRDKQWQMVESKIDKYTEENEIILPGLHYAQNKFKLTGDPDLLLYHTYRYKRQLDDQLNETVAGMKERVDRAVDDVRPSGEKEQQERKRCLENTLKDRRHQMDKEFKMREDELKKKNDEALKEALKTQLHRHEENLDKKLAQREKEATVKLNRMVAEKVAHEKKIFAQQRSEMAAKLKLLEDKLAAHLKAEKETKRSQELWAAASSLLAATKKGQPYVCVNRELKAIQKASGDDDKLVTTVMKTLPKNIWNDGIVPESVVKANYYKMEKTAMKVALVEREGSPLPIYFISWLQSMFLYFKVSGIPQVEVDHPPKEPPKELDTFDALQRARFWIEKGNLATAIKYVSSLEGASLIAAETWLNDAHALLETKQAAEAIIAHATALGLQYI